MLFALTHTPHTETEMMSPVDLRDKVNSDGDVNQCTHRRSSVTISLLLYSGTAIV